MSIVASDRTPCAHRAQDMLDLEIAAADQVHAGLECNRHALFRRLRVMVLIVAVDVADRVAVGDDIASKAPMLAQSA